MHDDRDVFSGVLPNTHVGRYNRVADNHHPATPSYKTQVQSHGGCQSDAVIMRRARVLVVIAFVVLVACVSGLRVSWDSSSSDNALTDVRYSLGSRLRLYN